MSTTSTTNAGAGYRNLSASKFDKTVVSEILESLFTETHPARSIAVEWLGCDGAKLGDATDDQLEKLLGDLVQAGHIEYSELEAAENAAACHSAAPEPFPEQPEARELATTEPQAPALGTGLPAQKPGFDVARQFLAALGTHHTYQTFDDTKDRKLPQLAKVINGDAGDELMHTLFNLNADGAGIFVTVNETNGKGRKRQNITRTRAIYGDFDGDDALALFEAAAAKLTPSIVVESSPDKRHAYWLVDMSPDEGEGLQAKMPEAVGCDPAAKDITRVLRIPGFYHRKGDPVLTKLLECRPERTYEAWEIISAFGLDAIEGKVTRQHAAKPHADPSMGAEYESLDYIINEADEKRVHAALRHVREDGSRAFDPANHATWVEVGMDLARSGEVGFKLFHDWSKIAPTNGKHGYQGEDDCRYRFAEFEKNTHSRYPNIFAKAQAAGWDQRAAVVAVPLINFDKAPPPPSTTPRSVINVPAPFPGIHSKLTTAILEASYIPQPNLASLCALIALAAIGGGSTYEDGTRCNLFGAVLSESSSGNRQ